MIALDGMEPRLGQPFQRGFAVRPTVDQVTHAEQAVHRRIETYRIQALLQALEVAMDIAHGQIPSPDIGDHPPKPCHYSVPPLVAPCPPSCGPCSWRCHWTAWHKVPWLRRSGGRFAAHPRLPEKPFTGTGVGADSMLGTSIFTREWF
ncbi:hypothetical protein PRJ_2880 [Pseudomonas sp. XWY-1]|nr:hypothetical protein PRJ_2880 [Pseudomonas sp. XWY-1]